MRPSPILVRTNIIHFSGCSLWALSNAPSRTSRTRYSASSSARWTLAPSCCTTFGRISKTWCSSARLKRNRPITTARWWPTSRKVSRSCRGNESVIMLKQNTKWPMCYCSCENEHKFNENLQILLPGVISICRQFNFCKLTCAF